MDLIWITILIMIICVLLWLQVAHNKHVCTAIENINNRLVNIEKYVYAELESESKGD